MKRMLGIVGGVAAESTIDYYRMLMAMYQDRAGTAPPLLIYSVDLETSVRLVSAGALRKLADYFIAAIEVLARGGADCALIASNTPHVAFDEIRRGSPLPLISIVEMARNRARAMNLQRLGLIGTGFTMAAKFYPETFAAAGMSVVVPDERDRAYIHDKYMGELVNGVFRDETLHELSAIIGRLIADHSIDGLILGGTELPLILRRAPQPVPFLDTARIHVEAAVDELLRAPAVTA